jgi:hypothetical protein
MFGKKKDKGHEFEILMTHIFALAILMDITPRQLMDAADKERESRTFVRQMNEVLEEKALAKEELTEDQAKKIKQIKQLRQQAENLLNDLK